jgi:DNA adenine methylase/adenine-specific DNA-methyltransferase
MGSKSRLLPWLHDIFARLDFETAADPFCGAGSVAYLLKTMGKEVHASDVLHFPSTIARALIANSHETLGEELVDQLVRPSPDRPDFIERTFSGIFYTPEDLHFLDDVWGNLRKIDSHAQVALALTALIRACMKRQPRGVFTVANNPDGSARYNDGRRDMRLSLREHFLEQTEVANGLVFDNGRVHTAARQDVFDRGVARVPDLVYFDPPYVPRADDNCYIKRYHFLEGLSCYWEGMRILERSKVRKIEKVRTPFGYKHSAVSAFEGLFQQYRDSIIVLSYSDNGYPDREIMGDLLGRVKRRVTVHERRHRYHFGTHAAVERAVTTEYVLVGTD